MTTPAVNTTQVGTLPCQFITYRLSDGVILSQGSNGIVYHSFKGDKRPPSANGISVNGWKYATPWSAEHFNYSLNFSQCRLEQGSNQATIYIPCIPRDGNIVSPPAFGGQLSDLESKAITQALKKLANNSPNLGNLIGERHETLKMFEHLLQTGIQAYTAFRRNNPKDWLTVLRHDVAPLHKLPQSWLEYQYGLRPLVQDIAGAAELCHKLASKQPPIITVKGMASESLNFNSYDVAGGGTAILCTERGKHTSSVSLSYKENSPLETATSALGINNPFITGWELLPWSFVVDWMIPIGDYISTWGAAYGWSFFDGSCTDMVRCKRFGVARNLPTFSTNCSDTVKGNYTKMLRKVYASSPLPRFPGFKDPVSYAHAANFSSLVAQAFLGGSMKDPRSHRI